MALSLIQCPKTSRPPPNNRLRKVGLPPIHRTSLSFSGLQPLTSSRVVVCAAFSAAGSSGSNDDVNPYKVLGANPLDGFDRVKAAYSKKRKDAERRGDDAALSQLEKAYDTIMMSQLTKRKKGETFGSFQLFTNSTSDILIILALFGLSIEKAIIEHWQVKGGVMDVQHRDKVVCYGISSKLAKQHGLVECPFSKSEVKDIRINMAISAVFTAWIIFKRSAEYKPLQFLAFVYVYRVFEKLGAYEPLTSSTFTEDGEDEGRMLRMGKRLLRSLALGYTGALNVIESIGGFIPVFLYNNQALLVTASAALMLHIMASYYK
ncbi:chloroplast J-like domain 1 [Striga asiatica]|uniref:Chloroplast J-like domain 1 n=1 Tax=Striga asiatica TaxID=4170 RepID=A0A5A7QJ40_STRAF|nr:chloroplast J-like domain 1 [Striga asiatica]